LHASDHRGSPEDKDRPDETFPLSVDRIGRSRAIRPDFACKRPNIQQQLHLIGAKGLPHDRQTRQPRRQHHAVCPGKSGLVVLITEDDLRETVSIGRNRMVAAKEPASEAGFGPFNSTAHTVEWRAVEGKPFAVIQRWPIADIQANRNPNELARAAADEFARDFKCGKDEVKVVGEKGAAVSLAKR
jgi:hypothetical protein